MTSMERIRNTAIRIEPAIPEESGTDVVDIFSIFRLVRRRIGLIIGLSALLVVAAVPVIMSIERTFYGETRILVGTPLQTLAPVPGEVVETDTEVERLWSRPVAERVIERLNLAERPEFNAALREPSPLDIVRERLQSFVSGAEGAARTADPEDAILTEYMAHLRVRRNGTSNVVQVGFSSEDPLLAAEVPNTILDVYREENRRRIEERVAQADGIVSGRIDEQARRARDARSAVAGFRRENNYELQMSAEALQTVNTLSVKRSDILRERAEIQSRLQSAQAASAAGNLETSTSGNEAAGETLLGDLRRTLHEQRLRLSELSSAYGPAHSQVAAAERRIAETEGALAGEIEQEIRGLSARTAVLDDADRAVAAALDDARVTLVAVRRAETDLGVLQARAFDEEKALEALEAGRRELLAKTNVPTVELEVLSPASVPIGPEGRGRLFFLIGWAFAASVVAFTVACAMEVIDRSVRSPRQLSPRAAALPATMIPRLPRRAIARAETGGRGGDPQLRDAMRSLLLKLESSSAGEGPQSLAITSALPGTGVSLVADALAQERALSGRPVLIVEVARSSSRRRFQFLRDAGRRPGLGDVIADGLAVTNALRRDPETGIDRLPWGDRPGSLFDDRECIEEILELARTENRFVVFDAPAVLEGADALLIAGRTDRTLLLIKWGATGRGEAEAAFERLAEVAGRGKILLGINMVRPARHALYGFTDAAAFRPARTRGFS